MYLGLTLSTALDGQDFIAKRTLTGGVDGNASALCAYRQQQQNCLNFNKKLERHELLTWASSAASE